MTELITKTKQGKIHEETHKCFKQYPVLKAFYSFSKYCPHCGEKIEKDGEIKSYECSSCGETALLPLLEIKYCPSCGEKFEKPTY